MKKGKIALASLAVVVALTGAFAFKASKFHAANLFYWSTAQTCKSFDGTSVVTGTTLAKPSDFSTGYFTTTLTTVCAANGTTFTATANEVNPQ